MKKCAYGDLLPFPVQIVERQSDAVLPVRHETRVERLAGLRLQAGHLRTFALQRAADHAIGQLLAELLREDLVAATLAELPGTGIIPHALVRRTLPDAPGLDHGFAATRAGSERLTFAGLLRQLSQAVPLGHLHDTAGHRRAGRADLGQKDRLVAPAMFDVGKALLPLRGELHILQLVDGDADEHPSGGGAAYLLALTLQVAAFDQALEYAGTGRGRADASRMARVVIQGGFQIAVRDETARMLHGGQQCGL